MSASAAAPGSKVRGGGGGFGRESLFKHRETGRGASGESVQCFSPLRRVEQQRDFPDQVRGLVGDVDVAEAAVVLVQQAGRCTGPHGKSLSGQPVEHRAQRGRPV
ncbi:hypothetical protein CU254_13185 [Amycolatopsis sp. AA4]|uniref:hypothetical protein n=1 Tax=Actinomycetes TaxID=1760 RepID=UPI0001B57508|nr:MULTISPECIES: hypothetical protein [Actinomycetes]ATY11311.1 hypothetical protein CU254_13185 [Amycolatopsis sp. AA4]